MLKLNAIIRYFLLLLEILAKKFEVNIIDFLREFTKQLVEGLGQKFDPKRFDWGIQRRLYDPLQRHGILIAINEGRAAAMLFHDYYGELYAITWILSYPLIIIGSRILWRRLSPKMETAWKRLVHPFSKNGLN